MCGSASVGVVQEAGRSTSSSASTFAHELGHVLNLQHDTSTYVPNHNTGTHHSLLELSKVFLAMCVPLSKQMAALVTTPLVDV